MSEPIITALRQRNLHKKPETLAAADQTRKLNAFRTSRGEEAGQSHLNLQYFQ